MMQTQTIILIALAFLASFGLSYIQYIYKAKTKRTYVYVLAFFRFISVFLIFLLLINPVFKIKSLQTEKIVLPILLDNTQSIPYLDSTFINTDWISYFKNHIELNNKFETAIYPFDKQLQASKTLNFTGSQTNIAQAAQDLVNLYRNTYQPIILVTDGNQTQGPDYLYAFNPNAKIFPVIVGDTTLVYDVQLIQANANKYVYINNLFPIEVIAHAQTDKNTKVTLQVSTDGQNVYKKLFELTPEKNIINDILYLKANRVGVKKYTISVSGDQNEKNTQNNIKILAVDVIDQKTEIAIISSFVHPDLGALKRAIQANEHRKVTILKPNEIADLDAYDLVLLYQPTAHFTKIFQQIKEKNKNYWIVGGLNTDYSWLNQNQTDFNFKLFNQKEQYVGILDNNFSIFEVPHLPFTNLPYLDFFTGSIESKTKQTQLLNLQTKGIKTDMPMVSFIDNNQQKKVYWFGENLWKWRIETLSDNTNFDQLIDKIIQYLAIKKTKDNLVVQIEPIYNQSDNIIITAQFFNKNLEYDTHAILQAQLTNMETKQIKMYDWSKRTNELFLNLSGLQPGKYELKVTETRSKKTKEMVFEVLPFNAEIQVMQANTQSLKLLATQSNGAYFYLKNIDLAIEKILNDPEYTPVQKEIVTNKKLINWPWALFLVVICLSVEWFLRKYNGMN
jgi:hypothetical protein